MARVLLTALEPLPGAAGDGAADAARILAETWHGSAEIVARELTPAYTEASRRLRASVAKHLPDAVIVVATRPDATAVTIERLAVNLDDAPVADAHGAQPMDAPIVAGAPAGLWTTLPSRELLEALDARGLPAQLSVNAGSGLANHVFYVLQRELAEWGVPSGLIQLPPTAPSAPGGVALPAEVLAEALRTIVETVLGEEHAEPAPPEPAAPEYDADATQPFLMPISDPIATESAAESAPELAAAPLSVAPTLAPTAASPSEPSDPGLPPAAGRPETSHPVVVPPWGPTSGEVPALEAAAEAPAAEAAEPQQPDDDATGAVRHPTWDEIISGRSDR
ncbi:pyroglutamyl-peptidase I family protein [Demequina mangrovi]|uniref:Pyrrolidone-carboxylate peptidase n=1 Tax=Demequina mangrovi TaxID=1043493 RepID=A0A1H6TNB8_9MICO|nr:hypothetical protein [Demequina mangrovi]SEI81579.1 pyroglutamyl-peptidase I [Demequina mangrovi]